MGSHNELVANLEQMLATVESADEEAQAALVRHLRALPPEERRRELCSAPEVLVLPASSRRDLMREAEDESGRGWNKKLAEAWGAALVAFVIILTQALALSEASTRLHDWKETGRAPLTSDQRHALERFEVVGLRTVNDLPMPELRQRLSMPLPAFELQKFLERDGGDGAAPEKVRALTLFLGVMAMGEPDEQRRLVALLQALMSESPENNQTLKRLCRRTAPPGIR